MWLERLYSYEGYQLDCLWANSWNRRVPYDASWHILIFTLLTLLELLKAVKKAV